MLGLGLILGFFAQRIDQTQRLDQAYNFTATPTVFVHGYHGSFKSERDMMTDIEKMGLGQHELTVTVSPKGKLSFQGHLDTQHHNPLIGVVFQDNTAGEMAYALWLAKVMRALKRDYHVVQYNAVGHSMGAVAWVLYAQQEQDVGAVPIMAKLVTIAGPFDGILGFGDQVRRNYFLNSQAKPRYQTKLFREMRLNGPRFPTRVPVLNIYGDLNDGTNSDGVVSVVSARSLRYLIKPYAKSYQTVLVTGPNAQHSALHRHNLQVSQAIMNFLWHKSDQQILDK
ncbi:hypothetical protein FC83_GL002273 [Agrilactobacillus composti DSM 18527 = JCM 14202]|uniref:Alpha beta hydrolase superfamily protein n=2 Tax=Agrilactobacillus TaxID=2767875 RepID=X0QRZ5_9LACO|nr:hypothetical protein FC83_GL002273 [Agrilactobacillus composti DSM 18527 = JCM 14202]GAF41400.1 cell surface hydrolase [Agrilactobacillus composti DSM 18527 = JCM 14202]